MSNESSRIIIIIEISLFSNDKPIIVLDKIRDKLNKNYSENYEIVNNLYCT